MREPAAFTPSEATLQITSIPKVSAQEITTSLIEELLSPEHADTNSLVAEIEDLRTAIELKEHTEITEIVENSPLWQERNRILGERLSPEELLQITELNEKLTDNPAILNTLWESLIDFQEKRLTRAQVDTGKIQQAINHAQDVINYTKKAPNGEPLIALIAAVHDIEKYGPGETVYLAEHEVASAIIGPRVLGKTLEAAGLAQYREPLEKLAAKAILCHGEGEFPELAASQTPIDRDRGIYSLFGGIYIKPPRSNEIEITGVPREQLPDEDTRNAAVLCRKIIEGVSEVDKISGMGISAIIKYDQEIPIDRFYNYRSSLHYILSYSGTFILNHHFAPEATGLKQSPGITEMRRRGGLLFSLLYDAQRPQEERASRRQIYIDELGMIGEQLFNASKKLHDLFSIGKASCQAGQGQLFISRVDYQHVLGELISTIVQIETVPTGGELEKRIDQTLTELEERWLQIAQ